MPVAGRRTKQVVMFSLGSHDLPVGGELVLYDRLY